MKRSFAEVEQNLISGFHRDVDQKCDLLGYLVASIATFRYNQSVQSSKVNTPKKLARFMQ
jgi:hypothetical protein